MDWLQDPIPSYHRPWNARFVKKNRRFLTSILSSVLYEDQKELFTSLSPLTKSWCFLLILVPILITRKVLPLWLLSIGWMVLLVRMEDRRLRQLLLEWVGLLLLPLLFYAPSFFLGIGSIMTLWKIALQLAWVTLFANSMSLQNIIDVLIWFRLPRVLIFQIETTFKYIYLLAVQLSKQLDTLSLRLTGAQTPMKVGIHLIGTLFLKTLDYMTDLGHAMVLRGSGPVYRRPKLPLQKIDWGCLCLCVLAACFFIFWS